MGAEMPNPESVRDLRLMYETCGYVDGNIEYKSMRDGEIEEGDIIGMTLRVVPDDFHDVVHVEVRREQATNVDCLGPNRYRYSSRYITDWHKVYTFDEFRDSPFYEMMLDRWCRVRCGFGFAHPVYWDTHLMDEHEVIDEDTRWYVYAHVYEHHRTWLGNWDKTGRIEAVDFRLDEDGDVEMGLTRFGEREPVYNGDVWSLQRIVDEHEQMKEQLEKLKKHGIDLDGGTLSIRLWEE